PHSLLKKIATSEWNFYTKSFSSLCYRAKKPLSLIGKPETRRPRQQSEIVTVRAGSRYLHLPLSLAFLSEPHPKIRHRSPEKERHVDHDQVPLDICITFW